MAERHGKTISFYTDIDTAEWLELEAEKDRRSVSNFITLIIMGERERRALRQPEPTEQESES